MIAIGTFLCAKRVCHPWSWAGNPQNSRRCGRGNVNGAAAHKLVRDDPTLAKVDEAAKRVGNA
jgi:hypothetical protein